MAEAKFYRCKKSGRVVLAVAEGSEECCGADYELLVPGTTDAATEKHVPVVSHADGKLVVNVGEVDHPMTEEHLIQFVALVTESGVQLAQLTAADKPHAEFADVEHGTVYEYCNLHGLWKTEF